MAFFLDVLDETGRTPREMGAAQIYVEPVLRSADGRAVLTVWIQAGLLPCGNLRLQLAARARAGDGASERHAGRHQVPGPVGSEVVRVHLPLSLPACEELRVAIEDRIPEPHRRVRAPWRTVDTQVVKPPLNLRSTLLDDLLGGAAGGVAASGGDSSWEESVEATAAYAGDFTTDPASAITFGFVAPVVAGEPRRLDALRAAVVWREGQPLPAPIARSTTPDSGPPRPTATTYKCPSCGYPAEPSDLRQPVCPACAEAWPESAPSPRDPH